MRRNQITHRWTLLVFGAAVVLLAVEWPWLQNTVHGDLLAVAAGGVGCVAAGVLLWRLPNLRRSSADLPSAVLLVLGTLLGSVALASSLNHRFVRAESTSRSVRIVDKAVDRSERGPERRYIFVEMDGRIEQLAVAPDEWEQSEVGGSYVLHLREGRLGFWFMPAP